LYFSGVATAQGDTSFEKVYNSISTEIAQKNLDKAISGADSLYKASVLVVHRMRSLMLMARLYQQKEELEKSVNYALQLSKLAIESKDYMWQARAYGYLAGLYRMMELYRKAETFSEKALLVIPRIKDAEQAKSTQGLMLQELSFVQKDQQRYRQAIYYLNSAGKVFATLKKGTDDFLINNERLLGDNYRLLENYSAALEHYRRARVLSFSKPDTYITGLIYKGMAEAELNGGDLETAKLYLDSAMKIADESQYLQIKEAIYSLTKEYYKKVNNRDQWSEAREKKDSVTGVLLDKRAQLLDNTYLQLEQRGVKAESLSDRKDIVIFICIVLLMLIGLLFFRYKRKQEWELAIFKGLIQEYNQKVPVAAEEVIPKQFSNPLQPFESPVAPQRGTINISAETEQVLISGLMKFEKSNQFLSNNISLPTLAAQLNTNTKYLSLVIKTNKQTDFNGYVNKLRINYVVNKLQTDPTWRQYKVSALADACGFSSPSQFAAIFKSVTGLSPSAFLRHLSGNC